jgi:hypothetical protein
MAYNTNNPVGSTDPRDLYDNAGNLDKFVNGDAPFYPDRLGQQRKSWSGMEADFASAQEGREAAFDQFLEASAFIWIGDYGTGLTFTSRSQYTVRDGYAYRLAESTTIPYTSTGNWALEQTKFSLVNSDDILRQELANGSTDLVNSNVVGYRGRKVREVLDDLVHCVDGSQLQFMLDNFPAVRVPHHAVLTVSGIKIPDNTTLIVDGTLRLPDNSPDGTVLVTYKSTSSPIGVRCYGEGLLDGNKANQNGASTKHTLFYVEGGDEIQYAVRRAKGNYFPRAISGTDTTGMIYFKNCTNSVIHDARGDDYGRECFWMYNCSGSEMLNLRAFGGEDSWSGFQFSGTRNRAGNWYSKNAGASSGSFDCTYSRIDGWTGEDNRFTNVINFGHSGIPASHSVASNLVAIGGDKAGTSNTCNGIQVAAGTVGLEIINAQAHNSPDNGLQISDTATDITVTNFRAFGCGGNGVRVFGAVGSRVRLNSLRASGNNGSGFRADGGVTVEIVGGDLSGNTGGSLGFDGSSTVTTSLVRLGSDVLFASQSLAGMVAGTPITINNNNVHTGSRILLQASNGSGSLAQPYVQSIGSGSFQIGVGVNATAGAFCRYQIL